MNKAKRIAVLGTGDAVVPDAPTPAPITAAARAGFAPELVDVSGVVFPGTPEARKTCAKAYVEAGIRAERDGYDALYINTVGDYGLKALREQVAIPVTGSGEGAIQGTHGRPFAIVTIWPPALRFIYEHVLADSDAVERCVGIHHLSADPDLATLGRPDDFVQDMKSCSLTSMTRIREACRVALAEQGAEVILLGCTCMQPVADLLRQEKLPVIEAMTAGYKHLESMLDAPRQHGQAKC